MRIFKNTKSLLLTLVCLCMLLVGCGNTETNTSDELVPAVEGRVAIVYALLEGEGITIIRDGNSEDAYEGMRIFAGDSIVTDGESSVYFRVDDDKNILLDKDSRMDVTEMTNGKLYLELKYGQFFFDVENKLKEDEIMEFKIGSTSMSVRGTSGAGTLTDGEGSFAIYDGVGALKNDVDANTEYSIVPNTIAHFNTEVIGDVELTTLKKEEVSQLLNKYAAMNDQYKEDLTGRGWTITDDGVIPSDTVVPETLGEKTSGYYVGWWQDADGSWNFSIDDFNERIGPTYYGQERKANKSEETAEKGSSDSEYEVIIPPTVLSCEAVYDGKEHSISITGFDSTTMKMTGTETAYKVGEYSLTIVPRQGYVFSDGVESIKATLTIRKKSVTVEGLLNKYTRSYDGSNTYIVADGFTVSEKDVADGDSLDAYVVLTVSSKNASENNTADEASVEYFLTGSGASNYTVSDLCPRTTKLLTQKVNLTVTLGNLDKVYDGDVNGFSHVTYSYSWPVAANDNDLRFKVYGNESDLDAGSGYNLNVDVLNNPGYNLTIKKTSYSISRRDAVLSVNVATETANSSKPGSITSIRLNAITDGVVEKDKSSVELEITDGNGNSINSISIPTIDGTYNYTAVPSLSGVKENNYNITRNKVNITVIVKNGFVSIDTEHIPV